MAFTNQWSPYEIARLELLMPQVMESIQGFIPQKSYQSLNARIRHYLTQNPLNLPPPLPKKKGEFSLREVRLFHHAFLQLGESRFKWKMIATLFLGSRSPSQLKKYFKKIYLPDHPQLQAQLEAQAQAQLEAQAQAQLQAELEEQFVAEFAAQLEVLLEAETEAELQQQIQAQAQAQAQADLEEAEFAAEFAAQLEVVVQAETEAELQQQIQAQAQIQAQNSPTHTSSPRIPTPQNSPTHTSSPRIPTPQNSPIHISPLNSPTHISSPVIPHHEPRKTRNINIDYARMGMVNTRKRKKKIARDESSDSSDSQRSDEYDDEDDEDDDVLHDYSKMFWKSRNDFCLRGFFFGSGIL